MNPESPEKSKTTPKCLVRSVSDTLLREPSLEAVTIERSGEGVSIATIGRTEVNQLDDRVSRAVESGQEISARHRCGLMAGNGNCQSCDIPLQEHERTAVTIQQNATSTTIARVTCPTAPHFWRWWRLPKLVPRELPVPEEEEDLDEWKGQLVAAACCGGLGLAAMLVDTAPWTLSLYLLSYLAGAWYTAIEVWERLQARKLDIHFLMLGVAAGSASIGAWGEGATLLFLFSLSGAMEHYAMGRTQREIRSLFKTAPKTATLLDADGGEHEVAVERLHPGQRLLVRPGAQFPVDAEVTKGETASDESNLTGEAVPIRKGVGDAVFSGTLNLWGAVEVVVLRPEKESALQKIVRLIQEAQGMKAPSQRLTDRFGTGYTYVILATTLVMFFVWWLGMGLEPMVSSPESRSAFYRAMTLLVVASPCALVLSIPSGILAAIATGARQGILFRGGAAVEKLAEIKVVALDKTGTLTTGNLEVDTVESFPPGRENEVAQVAFSMERLSSHPLAQAISRHGKRQGLPALKVDRFESVTGMGIQAKVDGQLCRLGRREWLEESLPETVPATPTEEPGFSEVWLVGRGLIGRMTLRDDVRPQAGKVLAGLKSVGLESVVLTGDRRSAVQRLQSLLDLGEVRAELKPEQKLEFINDLTRRGRLVAMVGDGVNDAPALAAAHVGVAMGARGADAALEQADVVLMHDRLENFLAAYTLSQKAGRVIRQNLFLSLGTVVILVGFALLGAIPLTLGVLGHEGSTVVVVLNSLRLLLSRKADGS